MDAKTLGLLDKIDAKLAQLKKELSQVPAEKLSQNPSEGAWSVLQVMIHLRMAEGYAHQYLQKKLSFDPKLPNTNLQSAFRTSFMNAFNRMPFKIKAPKGVDTSSLPKIEPLETQMEQWEQQRKALRAYLSGLDDSLFKKQVYKHPFAGRLSLAGMVSFFDSHFDRHYKQIQRTLKAVQS